MKSRKLTKKAAKSGKASLKAGSVGTVRILKMAGNHNETLVHNS